MDINKKQALGAGIGVMILKSGMVLLGKRHDDPEKASSLLHGEGTWTMPCGKLHFGDSFEEATCREILEETGVKVDKEKLKIISLANDIVKDAHFITVGLLCEDFEGEPKVMEPDEITEWKWFSLDNLPSPIFFPSKKIINNYLSKKFYKFKS